MEIDRYRQRDRERQRETERERDILREREVVVDVEAACFEQFYIPGRCHVNVSALRASGIRF